MKTAYSQSLMRYFFEIAYKGTAYHGWQKQEGVPTVQEVVEEALKTVTGSPIPISGSGRTDTGVHCRQQFFHADFSEPLDSGKFRHQLNSLLPKDIAINGIRQVVPEAHARFDASFRAYQYLITTQKDPFLKDRAWKLINHLDLSTMNKGAALLIGKHDYTSFSKVKTQVTHFECEVFDAGWSRNGPILEFNISANRFLRGMVRAIVGTLIPVGMGKVPPESIEEILQDKDRRKAGTSVPPEGLYLVSVRYPEHIWIN